MFLLGNYTPGKSGETLLLGGRKVYQLTNNDDDDLFFFSRIWIRNATYRIS